jgi:hypothetical protein
MSYRPTIQSSLFLYAKLHCIANLAIFCNSCSSQHQSGETDITHDTDTDTIILDNIQDDCSVIDPMLDYVDIIYDYLDVDYGHGIGSPCINDSDCFDIEIGAVCLDDSAFHEGGYCSLECFEDVDCGLDAICIPLTIGHYCHTSCKSDDDCIRDGYYCITGDYCVSTEEY